MTKLVCRSEGILVVEKCDYHNDGGNVDDKCPGYCDGPTDCRELAKYEIEQSGFCKLHAAIVLYQQLTAEQRKVLVRETRAITMCKVDACEALAEWRVFWPGQESVMCDYHKVAALDIAERGLGLTVAVVRL